VTMDECLREYRESFPVRPFDEQRIGNPDELRFVMEDPEVADLGLAPAVGAEMGAPPASQASQGTNKHLWVIMPSSVPYALEEGALGRSIAGRHRLSHTNLTGGEQAHCGGEAWFDDPGRIALTGGSGRYPPRSAAELESIVEAFRRAGYAVANCGWDEEVKAARRFWRTPPDWLEPAPVGTSDN
jgi:hypothetical protein